MASVPIITHIINGFDILISSIPEINQVMISPMQPVDRETAVFPFTAIYEEPRGWESRNRLEHNTSAIILETYFVVTGSKENLYLQAKYFEALIHKAIMTEILTGTIIKPYIENLRKNVSEYNFPDNELGAVIQEYEIDYLYTYGNPFTKENY